MQRIMLFNMAIISFCIAASDQKGNLYEADIFESRDLVQMRRTNSLLDAFMLGSLQVGYSDGKRVLFSYSDYEKPLVTYYSYSDGIARTVLGIYGRVKAVEQKTGCLRPHLTVISGKLLLNEKERGVIQAIRLYDFLNGKLAFPEAIEYVAERIQQSSHSEQIKQKAMELLEQELPYEELNRIVVNRGEYVRIFGGHSIREMKKDHGKLNWENMTLPQYVKKMGQYVAREIR